MTGKSPLESVRKSMPARRKGVESKRRAEELDRLEFEFCAVQSEQDTNPLRIK